MQLINLTEWDVVIQKFKTNVLSNKNIPYKKKLNLLNEENITKEEVAKKIY